ncbi:MAG: hypothetical protein Q3974_02070 [Rothia sp. (in: high G+C Gram-positive bacteria)]|nr:hypothetical protein [Rothia sp. (in: high G+C Gram-positive bacteria)]
MVISDVAAVAAEVLRRPQDLENTTLELTGPEALSMNQIAELITEVCGQSTRFENETVQQAYESRAVYQAPAWELDAWVSTYTSIAAGEMERVTDDVAQVLGRAPQKMSITLSKMQDGAA